MMHSIQKKDIAKSNKAGFTLLELLIAMMLTSVIGVVLFSTYRMVLENGQSLQRIVGERETARMVKAVIDHDMTSMLLSSDDRTMPLPTQNFIELSPEYYVQTGETIPEEVGEIILSFATTHSLTSNVDTRTPAPVCIEYVLTDSRRGKNLVRRERQYCGIEGSFPWTEILMLQNLESVEVALLIENEFEITWSDPKEPPSAIRFVFEYEDKDKEDIETFIVPLLPEDSDIADA